MTEITSAKYFGGGADKHCPNHFGDHYWYKNTEGGFTECCEYGAECEKHLRMRGDETLACSGTGGDCEI